MSTPLEAVPVLPVRSVVLLPGVVVPVEIGRRKSLRALKAASRADNLVLVLPQHDNDVESPGAEDLLEVGVLAEVVRIVEHSRNHWTAMLKSGERHRVDTFVQLDPYMAARVAPFKTTEVDDPETLTNVMGTVKQHLAEVLAHEADDPNRTRAHVFDIDDADELVELAAANVEFDREDQLKLLTETDPLARMNVVLPVIERLDQVLEVKADIRSSLLDDMSNEHRERVLRERLRAIEEELGETPNAEIKEYQDRMAEMKIPEEPTAALKRELRRMRSMEPSSAQYNVSRTYVEQLLDIPWGVHSDDTLDVGAARAILDADHAGLAKVKKRILEFIAVRKLAPDKNGPILCLVGPPGVGKTSLGRAIATALNRKYVRAALGGVRDESEIRGHRRTYIGALPGRIASNLKKAGTMNPVFVLDEVDKLGSDNRGDPTSALLEVLDPEQNFSFSDHYLEVPVDLSRVMFICTANTLETIPGPLRDRLEIIHVPSYIETEKLIIASKHLLPKQIAEHGIEKDQLEIPEETIMEVITSYTREAGVRNLERELAALCRSAAVKVAGGTVTKLVINPEDLSKLLGPARFAAESGESKEQVGVATGLAWTPVGGLIQFIEVRAMPGKGNLRLTGHVGDIMRESAEAAMSFVRANHEEFGISSDRIASLDLHLHVPAGGTKKDGPSAGLAMTTALVSLLINKKVRHDVAITGEITLRGMVLQVGGIKEKLLAAHRAGIKTVIIPERNRKDLIDVPKLVLDDLEVQFVKRIADGIKLALSDSDAEESAATGVPPIAVPAKDETVPDSPN